MRERVLSVPFPQLWQSESSGYFGRELVVSLRRFQESRTHSRHEGRGRAHFSEFFSIPQVFMLHIVGGADCRTSRMADAIW